MWGRGFESVVWTYFNVKCHFVYVMKIHKYERTLVSRKHACNILQRFPMFTTFPKVPLRVPKY